MAKLPIMMNSSMADDRSMWLPKSEIDGAYYQLYAVTECRGKVLQSPGEAGGYFNKE
jgi:hypothetical protein